MNNRGPLPDLFAGLCDPDRLADTRDRVFDHLCQAQRRVREHHEQRQAAIQEMDRWARALDHLEAIDPNGPPEAVRRMAADLRVQRLEGLK